jgi:hypothetical protein
MSNFPAKPVSLSKTMVPPGASSVVRSSSHCPGRRTEAASVQKSSRHSERHASRTAERRACDRFQDDWVHGKDPRIEEYLSGMPHGDRERLFENLFRIELSNYHADQTAPILQHYLARFPHFERIVRIVWQESRAQILGNGIVKRAHLGFVRAVRLTIVCGPHKGTAFTLASGSKVVIGRSRGSDLCLRLDGQISRQHIRLEVGSTQVRLFDLESRNGVVLNASKTTAALLRDGDMLRIGKTRIAVAVSYS